MPARKPALLTLLLIGLLMPQAAMPDQGASRAEDELQQKLEEAMRDLFDAVRPAIDEVQAVIDIFAKIDSLDYYDRPEILANGDILLRRRADAPPWPPSEAPDEAPAPSPKIVPGEDGDGSIDL